MNTCPCCSAKLLRHARHNGVYLFCTDCWQEMPDLSSIVHKRHHRAQKLERLINLSTEPAMTKSAIDKKETIAERSNSLINV